MSMAYNKPLVLLPAVLVARREKDHCSGNVELASQTVAARLGGSGKIACFPLSFTSCLSGDTVHYLLMYELAPDYLERRAEFRTEHLKLAWEAQARGDMVLAGALGDPADTALLLFSSDSPEPAERFAATDPYVTQGLVARWRVRQWNTVVGAAAFTPVKPE
jgi:uncharacterized protein